MTTRTYINAHGLSALEAVIRGGQLQFAETGSDVCFLYRSPEEKLVQLARRTYQPEPHSDTVTTPAIEAAQYLIRLQYEEEAWCSDSNLRRHRVEGTEDYIELAVKMARQKKERLSEIRSLLESVINSESGKGHLKHACALLGETFILDSDYESAFFWLRFAHAGPYRSTQHMLDTAMTKVAANRERGAAAPVRRFQKGYRYRPLEEWEKKQRRERAAEVKQKCSRCSSTSSRRTASRTHLRFARSQSRLPAGNHVSCYCREHRG